MPIQLEDATHLNGAPHPNAETDGAAQPEIATIVEVAVTSDGQRIPMGLMSAEQALSLPEKSTWKFLTHSTKLGRRTYTSAATN
jgi:hypothetical protein